MTFIKTIALLQQQQPFFFWMTAIILGLLIGSFLNVVIARLPIILKRQWYQECEDLKEHVPFKDTYPKRFNLVLPHSHCPSCQKPLRIKDNIPLLSFLWLKGQCHYCNTKISKRYPFVEAISALVVFTSFAHFGVSLSALAVCVLGFALIALTFIDLDEMLLPDQITAPLLWLGLFLNLSHTFTSIEDAIIGAMVGYLSL